jgi:hypothetical protein
MNRPTVHLGPDLDELARVTAYLTRTAQILQGRRRELGISIGQLSALSGLRANRVRRVLQGDPHQYALSYLLITNALGLEYIDPHLIIASRDLAPIK